MDKQSRNTAMYGIFFISKIVRRRYKMEKKINPSDHGFVECIVAKRRTGMSSELLRQVRAKSLQPARESGGESGGRAIRRDTTPLLKSERQTICVMKQLPAAVVELIMNYSRDDWKPVFDGVMQDVPNAAFCGMCQRFVRDPFDGLCLECYQSENKLHIIQFENRLYISLL